MAQALDNPRHIEIPTDVAARGDEAVAFYQQMVAAGQSPAMAEMLACRSAPGSMTDREMFRGAGTLDHQFRGQQVVLDKLVATARARGYEPSPNDFYIDTIAEDFGDPLAFVSAAGGRSHIKKVCQMRRKGLVGMVKVASPPTGEAPVATRLDPKIVNDEINQRVKADPRIAKRDRRELAEALIDKHGGKKE